MTKTKDETALVPRSEAQVVQSSGGGGVFSPGTLRDVLDFGRIMAGAGDMIPKFCRDNPGACCAVTLRALRWGMDPFAVAEKAYQVTSSRDGSKIAYEAQIIHAALNTSGVLVDDLEVSYEGEGGERRCTVTGSLNRGTRAARAYTSPMVKDIKVKNSPLWVSDPDQQLHYFSTRNWARRYCPEVILGAYTREEIESGQISEADRVEAIEHRGDVLDDDAISDPDEPLPTAPIGARMSYRMEKCSNEGELQALYMDFVQEVDALGEEAREPLRDLYAAHLKRVRGQAAADEVMAYSRSFRVQK